MAAAAVMEASALAPEWRAAFDDFMDAHPAAKMGARSREAAFARLEATGLPTRRDEYWRYTRVTDLTPATGAAPTGAPAPLAEIDAYTLVFVDGVLDRVRSDRDALAEKIDVAGEDGARWMDDVFGVLQTAPHDGARFQIARPIADLNMALWSDGLAFRVPAGVTLDKPVHLRFEGAAGAHLRIAILLEEGAGATVIESGAGALTLCAEVALRKGAAFDHLRVQTESAGQRYANLFANVADGARFSSFVLTADGALTRNETVLTLEGENAIGNVAGATMARGKSHVDNTVYVTHGAVAGESRQVFKTVLDDQARGVFQGKILVRQPAQKTDGYQISQSVLLSERAEFDAKPELEIYADDVKCSHGSTTGALDETALFYLRSRGVSREAAEALLVAAFLEEAIEEITDESLQDAMRSAAAAWMAARRR